MRHDRAGRGAGEVPAELEEADLICRGLVHAELAADLVETVLADTYPGGPEQSSHCRTDVQLRGMEAGVIAAYESPLSVGGV